MKSIAASLSLISIISFMLTGCLNTHWVYAKTDLPDNTLSFLETCEIFDIYSDVSILCDDSVTKDNNNFYIRYNDYIIEAEISRYSNPSKTYAMCVNPLSTYSEFDSLIVEPVKVLSEFTLADGTVWDVEVLSHYLDYSKIQDSLPVTMLPVSSVIFYLNDQERLLINFTVFKESNPILASKLLSPDAEIISKLTASNDAMLATIAYFVSNMMFKEPIINATL